MNWVHAYLVYLEIRQQFPSGKLPATGNGSPSSSSKSDHLVLSEAAQMHFSQLQLPLQLIGNNSLQSHKGTLLKTGASCSLDPL